MKIPLGKPVFNKEMENAAINALQNERFVLGESVHKFEEEFSAYIGTDYAVAVSSGTEALRMSLLAAGLKPDENAITSPASFIASANAILHANGKPVFADIDLKKYTVNPAQVESIVNEKTRAIIPVHLYGYPADMDEINEIAQRRELTVIEDACQAHGAEYNGKKIGSIGTIGCFSFYPSKNMTVCGDGGMITTNNKTIAEKIVKLSDCGRQSQYVHDIIGYTSRLNTVNAAIGRVQLRHLDEWNRKRREIANRYHNSLKDIPGLILPPEPTGNIQPVYHLYVIRTNQRDELKNWLESQGIGCGIHYALPIHLQPIYQEMFRSNEGTYPNAEELCKTCLSIPMYPDLTDSEINFVTEKIKEFFNQ